ncbi:MAG: ATP-dependent RNA helicase HrpA [Chitinispirillaceae bacterium]
MNHQTEIQHLPILEKRSEIISALKDNQVIVVAGQTGSGKTTQLPLFCLEAGLGSRGKIGCTQPRRIAATSIASRVATQMNCQVGDKVGYKIRFSDKDSENTIIKFMTDGILLAETEHDRLLTKYDTIIIDEAHERSLNIDFLLGYLRQLLPKRPDLKLIISSATIDTELFSKSFSNAPVIEVSGRLYPIDLLYIRPDEQEEESFSYVDSAVTAAVDLLDGYGPGDMLLFMPTERDIRETCDKLGTIAKKRDLLILPLFSRLTRKEQDAIFSTSDRSKIVVCTNIAETSITVPGIRYVVDTGLARISRYAPRLRTNRLPIEPVSRASADQRKGRCGRVQEGVCIRLYSEEEYLGREEFTQPEIKRSNLAGVILTMKAHGLGSVERFPFIDPPSTQAISEGYAQLRELGALDQNNKLTRLGKEMARLPFDPHISRMVLAAKQENALREVKIIAAALSIVDPRERPFDKQAEADYMHRKFTHESSDFMTYIKLWDTYQSEWKTLRTQNKMRKFCKDHFLSYTRMREWHDVHQQLHETLSRMKGFHENSTPAGNDAIHRSLLTGLLANCAYLDSNGRYRAAKGKEVKVFPGSVLSKKRSDWIMCHEIVQTSQVFARTVAQIKPSWIEDLAGPLCRHSYDAPYFDARSGTVKATRKVSLFGLPLAVHRNAPFGRVDPEQAGDIFIREGLVEENLRCHHPFYKHNRRLKKQILQNERKLRTRALYSGDEVLFRFYHERLPKVTSIHDLNRMIRKKGGDTHLFLKEEDILSTSVPCEVVNYPDRVSIGDRSFPLSYAFDPGSEKDGVTLKLPLNAAPFVKKDALSWLVPAMWPDLIRDLLRNLPRELRRNFIPVNESAKQIAASLRPCHKPFELALSEKIEELYGVTVDPEMLEGKRASPHLNVRIEIKDKNGEIIAQGRGSEVLENQTVFKESQAQSPWEKAFNSYRKSGLTTWPEQDISEPVQIGSSTEGLALLGYPTLVDCDSCVDLVLFSSKEESVERHHQGVTRLLEFAIAKDLAWTERDLNLSSQVKLMCSPFGPGDRFRQKLYRMISEAALDFKQAPVNRKGFDNLVLKTKEKLRGAGFRTLSVFEESLRMFSENVSRVGAAKNRVASDIKEELCRDLNAHFTDILDERVTLEQFLNYPRYLRAFSARIDKAISDPLKYRQKRSALGSFEDIYESLREEMLKKEKAAAQHELNEFRMMVREYEISLFAQHIRTIFPISEKRLGKQADEIRAELKKGQERGKRP